jgi:2-polyprenyl-3-methyl-5-hydroxy-6-metoxy-1,4-benzoquinol methylase
MFMLAIITYVQCAAAFSIEPSARDNVRLSLDGTANDDLRKILNDGCAKQISLDGFVSKRRAIGKSLVFLDIVPSDIPQLKAHHHKVPFNAEDFASVKPVQALMRRDIWKEVNKEDDNAESQYDVYQKIIQPGVYCSLVGEAGPSRLPNEALLFCHSASYILPNDNPQHLRNVIKFARDGLLDLEEVCAALPCTEKEEILQLLSTEGERQLSSGDCAAEILSRFPRNFLLNPSKLMGHSNSAKVSLLPPAPYEYKVPADVSYEIAPAFSGSSIVTVKRVLDDLPQSLETHHTPFQQFTISGFVQNRRRFQDSTSVVELVETFSSSAEVSKRIADIDMTTQSTDISQAWSERIHVVIDPNIIGEEAAMYGNILAAGSQIAVTGHVARADKSGMVICWASKCRLLKSSWKLNAVRQILELLHENKIDIEEATDALALEGGYAQAEHIASGSTSSTDRQWMATEISQSLQGEHSRYGKITSLMTKALDQYANLRKKYPIEASSLKALDISPWLKPNNNATTKASHDSKWERTKKPQLAWMIHQISHVLTSHPAYGQRTLNIVDIGGGKGLLSNLLAETFKGKVDVQVVDISRSATNNGMMRARRRGIENVSYYAQDATTVNVEGVDVVVALHACGALSDVALGHAVSQGAGFVICPW